MAARAGVHAARVSGCGPGRPQRPEGDLPGERAEVTTRSTRIQAAERRLERQVHLTDQL